MSVYEVNIYYGPSPSFPSYYHKPQKLEALRNSLLKLGYRVLLHPVSYTNMCVLEICGHQVFSCNIKYLSFNLDAKLSPVCQRAVEAVKESTIMFSRSRNYLYCWELLGTMVFERNIYGPPDYWVSDGKTSESKALAVTAKECATCCGIQTQTLIAVNRPEYKLIEQDDSSDKHVLPFDDIREKKPVAPIKEIKPTPIDDTNEKESKPLNEIEIPFEPTKKKKSKKKTVQTMSFEN